MDDRDYPSPSSPSTSNLQNCSKEQLIEMLQGFQEIFSDPKTRSEFLKSANASLGETAAAIQSNRASRMPYYKRRYASELQLTIDAILNDKKNRIYRYEDFPGISKTTLYLKISQAFLYLVDLMDTPDKKYTMASCLITVRKNSDGVLLEYSPDLKQPKLALSSTLRTSKGRREWKTELTDFIENASINSKLVIKDISLTPEEEQEAKMMLFGFESNFLFKISGTEIILIRIDPENPPKI